MMHLLTTTSYGVTIPGRASLYGERVHHQARAWVHHAATRCRLTPERLEAKAGEAERFCTERFTRGFCVPTKLVGVAKHQAALESIRHAGVPEGYGLTFTGDGDGDGVSVSYGSTTVGMIQPKHVPWLAPLVTRGVTVHLLAVTGTRDAGRRLGLNVALAHIPRALGGLENGSIGAPHAGGDTDVLLWRDGRGVAHANVRHVRRHSQAIEWGYGGAGPSDLARSILMVFAPEHVAERHYATFKAQVVAHVPHEGGLVRAALVSAWLCSHGAAPLF